MDAEDAALAMGDDAEVVAGKKQSDDNGSIAILIG